MPEIIRIPLPSTTPNDTVNMYLIKDDPLTLVDAGFNNSVTRQRLAAALETEGLTLKDIRRVALTHTHPDHVGMAAALQRTAGAEVYLHPREWGKIKAGTADNNHILRWAGVPPEVLPAIRSGPAEPPYPNPVHCLDEGDTLPFAGTNLHVLHLPGHSSGLIAFYAPSAGIIFTGDHLVSNFPPALLVEPDPAGAGRTASYDEYFRSLRRLEDLPLRHVYPGHGDPFTAWREGIRRLYAYHSRKLAKLRDRLGDRPKTAFTLQQELSPGQRGFIVFFAVGDTIAHLDKLVARGEAAVVEEDGVLYYRRRDDNSRRIRKPVTGILTADGH
ncbi:MAG: MBL fold metallo-hydrolase [bacterium]